MRLFFVGCEPPWAFQLERKGQKRVGSLRERREGGDLRQQVCETVQARGGKLRAVLAGALGTFWDGGVWLWVPGNQGTLVAAGWSVSRVRALLGTWERAVQLSYAVHSGSLPRRLNGWAVVEPLRASDNHHHVCCGFTDTAWPAGWLCGDS